MMPLFCTLCLLLGGLGEPAAKVMFQEALNAELSFNAPKKDDVIQLPFTQALEITVKVVSAGVEEVELPERFTLSGGWKEQSRSPAQRNNHEEKGMDWRQTVRLVALAPGQLPLRPEPLRYRLAGQKTWKGHALPPVSVVVTTSLTDADPKSLRDITAIEALPAAEPSRAPWGLFLGLLGMAGLAGGIAWWRRRTKAAQAVGPASLALHQLNRLRALDLPAKGHIVRFHHLLANVIRAYVEKRFGVPARRQTNPEFLRSLDQAPWLVADHKNLLGRLLEQCDQARFARHSIDHQACQLTLALTEQLITTTAGKGPACER